VPFLLEDLICGSAGDPLYNGSRLVKASAWSRVDTNLAGAIGRGVVFLGKNGDARVGPHATSEAIVYGPTRNRGTPRGHPAARAAASAAAVASCMVRPRTANTRGGSIRIPRAPAAIVV